MRKNILGIKPVSFSTPRKRDMQRAVNPFKRVREPIKAGLRKRII